jgi:subtilase family serine protease
VIHRLAAAATPAALGALVVLAVAAGALAPASRAAAAHPQRRVVLLGLRQRGELPAFARRVSNPASSRYRQFASLAEFRRRFSARAADRRRVLGFLRNRRGVESAELSSTRTIALAVMTPAAARRTFCVAGPAPPTTGLCIPQRLRPAVRQISAGESYQIGGPGRAARRKASTRNASTHEAAPPQGNPQGCQDALKAGGFTPNQLATAYGVDGLRAQGLGGQGVRVVTLTSETAHDIGLGTWAHCFDLPEPNVRPVSMPGGSDSTAVPSTEESLDIEALSSLAPRLARITPIFVPLDQGFGNSFPLFMFGALDPARQGGRLPDVLSISDGVCERQFTHDQLRLGQRMLREAAALGITALAASGDAGFLGCESGKPGANFPNSSRFVTGVGGTKVTLDAGNGIASQVVWSTFATAGSQAVGSGGGPSSVWGRPSFQTGPGIGPALQRRGRTRLGPDVAAMASFEPGISTYDAGQGGWGTDGGTSAATPLTAAMVALVREQERAAGRPALGSLPPLLYSLARGPDYHSIFDDVTAGTGSRHPDSPAAQTAAGGAAQPGYDLATGLGSLNATAFAAAVAAR